MTPEQIADCKAIRDTLTANPMTGVTAKLATDGALDVTYDDVSFVLRHGSWCGNAVSITCRLRDPEHASAVHREITRIGGMMAVAADKPNPHHAAELAKIAAALGHTGVMTGLNLVALAKRVKAEEVGAREAWGRVFDLNTRLGLRQTASHEEAVEVLTTIRKTDPLGMLGAPAAYDNGQALTVKERLLYVLARIT